MTDKSRFAVAFCIGLAAFASVMTKREIQAQTYYLPRASLANVYYAAGPVRHAVTELDRSDPRFPALQKVNELRKKLEAEQSNEVKRELESSLRDAIAEYFERDMEHRRAELARLRKRTEETETLVSERATAKEDLIDLQLQAIANSAEGLGLFGEHGIPFSTVHTRTYVSPGPQIERVPIVNTPIGHNGRTSDLPSLGSVQSGSVQSRWKEHDSEAAVSVRRLREAYRVLRAAESAEDRSMARDELRSALSEYFDADMEHRRRELQQIKKGLKDMESRLEKRAAAKEQIVALQLKLFVNDAQGLNFFAVPDREGTASQTLRPARPAALAAPRAAPVDR